jgi:hypothetical protein
MTDVTHTPPALRWVALFLAACAVLGLFLGFRDQIRKNPPGWYTGAEQIATPLTTPADGAREAVAFDPATTRAPAAATAPAVAPAPKTETPKEEETDAEDPAEAAATKPGPATRPRPANPPLKIPPPADPVGDILEGQKDAEPAAPPAVPY